MNQAEWALLGTLSVLWGGSFFFIAIAVAELPPLTLVLARVAIAPAALLLGLRLVGHTLPRAVPLWAAFMLMGLLNNLIPFSLIVWSQTRIGSGLASILNATTPLWAVLLAHGLTPDERLTRGKLAGVLLGFLGVAVMLGPDALSGLGADPLAQLAMLLAAFFYACSGLYGRRFAALPPPVTAAGQLSMTSLLLLPIVLLLDRPWTLPFPGPASWAAVLGLALLSTALAYLIFFRILARAGATNLLLVTFLIPVSAILLGTLFLGEHLAPRQLAGMALIGLGLAAIDGRLVSRLVPRQAESPPPHRR